MRLALVTPVLDRAALLEETIRSVLAQTAFLDGSCSLDYLVVDGGSRDGSHQVAQELLQDGRGRVLSEPDNGMYDALAKGLGMVDGDMVGYLNAGDLLHPRALAVLRSVWEEHRPDWVRGLHTIHGVGGEVLSATRPYRYRRDLIRAGVYGRFLLPHIQQESTFWSRRLLHRIDLDRLRGFQAAGDYYLWYEFAAQSELGVIGAQLGGFRWHDAHLSSDRRGYLEEMTSICGPLSRSARVAAFMEHLRWLLPLRWRDRLPQRSYVQTPLSSGRFLALTRGR